LRIAENAQNGLLLVEADGLCLAKPRCRLVRIAYYIAPLTNECPTQRGMNDRTMKFGQLGAMTYP